MDRKEGPAPAGEQEKRKSFKKKNRVAHYCIVLRLSKEAVTNVSTILLQDGIAKDIWENLKRIY